MRNWDDQRLVDVRPMRDELSYDQWNSANIYGKIGSFRWYDFPMKKKSSDVEKLGRSAIGGRSTNERRAFLRPMKSGKYLWRNWFVFAANERRTAALVKKSKRDDKERERENWLWCRIINRSCFVLRTAISTIGPWWMDADKFIGRWRPSHQQPSISKRKLATTNKKWENTVKKTKSKKGSH